MVTPGDEIGSYRILSLLGSGGMGEVWLAEHVLLEHQVAIKFLRGSVSDRADIVKRFFSEAKAATKIGDPGIVQIHDFGWHDAAGYIVMEHVVGESLAARLQRVHILPLEVARTLMMQVALTMAVAHGRGIIHRDLKPDNLFVVSDPAIPGGERIKILDFGIAKLASEEDSTSKTQTGAILGTPMYMSPEQCRGVGVDHRTDIYALGGVLHHLVCGRPPFIDESSADLIAAHLMEEPDPPSAALATVTPDIDAIVKRCLAKDPADRYQTMSELARDLALTPESRRQIESIPPASSSLSRTPIPKAPPNIGLLTTLGTSAAETIAPTSRRTRWLGVGAALALATIVAIASTVVIAVRSSPDGSPGLPIALPTTDAAHPSSAVDAASDSAPDAAERDAPTISPDARKIHTPRRHPPPSGSPDSSDLYETRDHPLPHR